MTGNGARDAADALETAELDESLAAETALGLPTSRQRERLEERAGRDMAFARRLAAWRRRLSPLDADFDATPPPASVKAAIDRRLDREPTLLRDALLALSRWSRELWRDPRYWRAATAGFLAAFLVSIATAPSGAIWPEERDELIFATLETQERDAQFLVIFAPEHGSVRMLPLRGGALENAEYHLWIMDDETKAAAALGHASASTITPRVLEPGVQELLVPGAMVGLSIEPQGGAKDGAPTGPIVALTAASEI